MASIALTGAVEHEPAGLAIVGCGSVSRHYLRMLRYFSTVSVLWCVDHHFERAAERARSFGIGRPATIDIALTDPDVEVVVNLTPPLAHEAVTRAALDAGKSVYTEKPLAADPGAATELVALAADRGLTLGCAPDTVLGEGMQTCRVAIDKGAIGEPIAFHAFVVLPGHELWHPDPGYYYKAGVGPLLDMGPYPLTALVHLLGPVRRVAGRSRLTGQERRVQVGPKAGDRIPIKTPTTVQALLDLVSGVVGTLTCTFDGIATACPPLEIFGTEGALIGPDPNTFRGPVQIASSHGGPWSQVAPRGGYDSERGIGVADLVSSHRADLPPRVDARVALHVLEVMAAIEISATENRFVDLVSTCERPRIVADLGDYGWTGITDPAADAVLAAMT